MKCAYLLLYEKDAIESISERKSESIPLLFITEGFWDLFFASCWTGLALFQISKLSVAGLGQILLAGYVRAAFRAR